MKRLLETHADSPLVARAQRLLASAEPVPYSQERMWRIRRELDQPRSALAFFRGVPAIGVAGALLFFGASAFAAVRGMSGLVASFDRELSPARARLAEQSVAAAPQPQAEPEPVAGATPAPEEQVANATPSQLQPRPSYAARSKHLRRSAANTRNRHQLAPALRGGAAARLQSGRTASKRPLLAASGSSAARSSTSELIVSDAAARADVSDTSARVAQDSETAPARERSLRAAEPETSVVNVEAADLSRKQSASPEVPRDPEGGSELVHRALKALRRDRDPQLAASLLARHRARYPEGALAEEALALQIEAASLSDRQTARSFAREYLKRFPNGRYRSAAERALQDRAP